MQSCTRMRNDKARSSEHTVVTSPRRRVFGAVRSGLRVRDRLQVTHFLSFIHLSLKMNNLWLPLHLIKLTFIRNFLKNITKDPLQLPFLIWCLYSLQISVYFLQLKSWNNMAQIGSVRKMTFSKRQFTSYFVCECRIQTNSWKHPNNVNI